MSVKNNKAYNQGIEDRKNNIPFSRNYFQYMSAPTSSSYWDKGWIEQDKKGENNE